MGKEFPLACKEEEGQPVLLAIASSGELIAASSIRDQRTKKIRTPRTSKGRATKNTKTKSKSSGKIRGANGGSTRQSRRKRNNKNRKSNRGYEGEDITVRRSAKILDIAYPGSYCNGTGAVPHYWQEVEKIYGGALFKCRLCSAYLWLPTYYTDALRLGALMHKYGTDEGYCRYLDKYIPVKVLISELQQRY